MYLRGPRKILVVHEEPRAAMIAHLDTPLGPLTVANTHLSFVPGWNRVQLRSLARDLRGFPGPRVLMGDLNMRPPIPSRWTGLRALGGAPTFPADEPRDQLDHILTDDRALCVEECAAPRLPVSDHRALLVDVSRV
jgi:endonuclease/exonuclease/phosphatase family metal-dependent hydrolase